MATRRRHRASAPSQWQCAENALDVPHTAFLHRGLFRSDGTRRPIDVVIRRWHDRVEAQYIGEERPKGIVGWLLAASSTSLGKHIGSLRWWQAASRAPRRRWRS